MITGEINPNTGHFGSALQGMVVAHETHTLTASVDITVKSASVREISAPALRLMEYVAASTRLSPEEKTAIIRLTAFIDEFVPAGKRKKLLEQLAAVVQLMEMAAKERYSSHSIKQVLDQYFSEREKLQVEKNGGFQISLRFAFEQFTQEFLAMDYETAIAKITQVPILSGEEAVPIYNYPRNAASDVIA